jgi:hypothetical protein
MNRNEWNHVFGDNLVADVAGVERLPDDARAFIRTYSLPKRVIFEWQSSSFEISFDALASCAPLNTIVGWGDFFDAALDQKWSQYFVIATESFSNGAAYYCVNSVDAGVRRIDVELEDPETFVNSSVEQFAHSLLRVVQWSSSNSAKKSVDWTTSVVTLEKELAGIDALALNSTERFWPAFIEQVRASEPTSLTVTADISRSRLRG